MLEDDSIATLAAAVFNDTEEIVEHVLSVVRAEVFHSGPGADIENDDIRHGISEVLRQYQAILRQDDSDDASAIDAVIRRRYAQGVALLDLLHDYRVCAGAVWERLLNRRTSSGSETLLAATPRIFDMVDRFSLRAYEVYRQLSTSNIQRQEQIRATLLDTLFYGDAGLDEAFWNAVSALRIPRHGHFLVVDVTTSSGVATPTDWEDIVTKFDDVNSAHFRLGLRSQVGLVNLHTPTPASTIGKDLASLVSATLGLSAVFTSISRSRDARVEAGIAAAAASAVRPAVSYSHDVLDVLMASAPAATSNLVRITLGGIQDLPPERAEPLVDTVRVWLANRQSVSATATALQCHRNTVTYRLKRFEELCGRSLADNIWLAQVTLAVNSAELIRRNATARN